MKLVKSLLLGTAAGIAAVAGAQAADLPSRKAAPVEYVRVCTAYGAGFFYIPGTDSCLRISGRVRAEYAVGQRYSDYQDAYGTRARGRLNIDVRTATAYGTLRTFIRYELTNNTGIYTAGTGPFNTGANVPGLVRGAAGTGSLLDLAYVQFGPITAGRAQSFFDFYASDLNFASIRTADSRVNLLAYTATFGSGFSATVSLEDRTSGTVGRELGGVIGGIGFLGTAAAVTQGQDYPDIVASLRVDQGWGSAQLSGAVGQRKYAAVGAAALGAVDGDEVAWAIQGGVKINLPMLAAGDALWLQAAYADGALGYLGWSGNSLGLGRLGRLTLADASINPVTGKVDNSTGWSVVAAFRHFWTPTLRTEIGASYSELKLGYVDTATALFALAPRSLDPKEFLLAANLIWSPVSGLDIGVEVLYSHLDVRSPVGLVNNASVRSNLLGIKSEDSISGRLRIQRDF
ncbi:porin [Bosea minatitlanensis]|uniref:Porin n=1 Tax=Bosea minatitlanensis TaxID=128782 RepID=A0ABW0F3Q0_9HYPH|nr:porin [Bosea minatitlanensis]MCT4492516.1 porin [Bosea minatitlanensis]